MVVVVRGGNGDFPCSNLRLRNIFDWVYTVLKVPVMSTYYKSTNVMQHNCLIFETETSCNSHMSKCSCSVCLFIKY